MPVKGEKELLQLVKEVQLFREWECFWNFGIFEVSSHQSEYLLYIFWFWNV